MNLYIDKSKNEQGEQEFSIHGLSKLQILLIKFFIVKGNQDVKVRNAYKRNPDGTLPEDTKKLIDVISNFDANA